ncbi:MAG: translocation/assembly module TamB domain-containing protein [Deltaproteobacteria bacterium]|nr:translocation/assembly module TamB domain-containing protein [Deltaproteobacteria bacterium]
MKRSVKILLYFVSLVIFLSCVLASGALVIWCYPHLALNSRTLPWLISKASGSESTFNSKQLEIEIQTPHFWRRDFIVTAENACLERSKASSCFTGKIEWSLRLSILHGIIIPNFLIHSSNFNVQSKVIRQSESSRQNLSSEVELIHLPRRLARGLALFESRQMDRLDLRFDRVQLNSSEMLPSFSFSLLALRSEKKAKLSFQTMGPSRVSVNDCNLLWSGTMSASTLQGQCSWTATLPKNLQSLNLFKRSQIQFDSDLDLHIRNGQITDDSQLKIIFNDLESKAIHMIARIKLASEDLQINSEPSLQWEFDVSGKSFQKLSPLLARFGYEVPAPFHVLEGSFQFVWRGLISHSLVKSPSSNFFLRLDLASKEQKFVAEGNGKVLAKDIFEKPPVDVQIELDLVLKEIQLVAPPLILRAPPALLPDKRFRVVKAKPDAAKLIRLQFDVHLRTEKPLLIKTDITLSAVPISFDLRFRTNHAPVGNLLIHRVALDLFRRNVELQRLSINFEASGRSRPISGEIRVRYVGYTVSILLDGEFSRPRIQLRSEPALSEDDIVAVLLFGSPLNSLGMEDVSSVASFKGAAVARAVTLASLYFLVATPIQSISFNPQTLAFGAQVRLPRNLALRLGVEDEGTQYMGLRKRISREVYLETEFRHPQTDSENRGTSLSTYLLWFKRH